MLINLKFIARHIIIFLHYSRYLFAVNYDSNSMHKVAFKSLPSNGFIRAYSSTGIVTFHTLRRVLNPQDCMTIEFQNIPTQVAQLTGGRQFYKYRGRYNGRYAWTNGKEILSFIDKGDFGTWIIGDQPGQDSGFVYFKPTYTTLTPLNLNIDDDKDNQWHWLTNGKWTPYADVRAVCIDANAVAEVEVDSSSSPSRTTVPSAPHASPWKVSSSTSSFYEIEYYDSTSSAMQNGYLYSSPDSDAYTNQGIIQNKNDDKTITVTSFEIILDTFSPVRIEKDGKVKSTIAYLVNHEMGSSGWSLTFRRYSMSDPVRDLQIWENKHEVRLELSSLGAVLDHDCELRTLTDEELLKYYSKIYEDLKMTNVNDYVWLFMKTKFITESILVDKYKLDLTIDNEGESQNSSRGSLNQYRKVMTIPRLEENEEVVLKCIARNDDKLIFQYYPSHRREQMAQSELIRDGDLYEFDLTSYNFSQASRSHGSLTPMEMMLFSNVGHGLMEKVVISGVFSLTSNPIPFIRDYIREKEGVAGQLSACYFYHAAVSLPQPLLYAAEIICVLMGAKPVVLIQYTSDSDAQHKFPLISELTSSVIASKRLYDSVDIDYQINRFRNLETLIFYREDYHYVVENLLDRRESQALHPQPFPDSADPPEKYRSDQKYQIYYAWWNGYLLGYPERFVDSYCMSFHNDLTSLEKAEQSQQAKRDVKLFLQSINRTSYEIKLGLLPPVPNEVWNVIEKRFS